MHLLLTDHLICPRCENESGLILLSERMVDRRVETGAVGCPQCRTQYPIRDGIVDLRTGATPPPSEMIALDAEGAHRLAALIGVTEGPAFVLVVGLSTESAAQLAAVVPGVEIVSAGADDGASVPGVSRLLFDGRIPIRTAGMNGVAVTVAAEPELHADASRVLDPLGRLVLTAADELAVETLTAAGMRVVAQEGNTAVAVMSPDRFAGPSRI